MRLNIKLLSVELIIILAAIGRATASDNLVLSLPQAVTLANDSSLEAFRNRHLYAISRLQWHNHLADRRPSLSLTLQPAQYYRYITSRYDSQNDIDIFRSQKLFKASAGLGLTQNVDFLGGQVYVESDLEFLRNFGSTTSSQYSSVPFRIGYSQQLIGFNSLKWDRRIEPMRFEEAKLQLLASTQELAMQVTERYFDLLLAQTEITLAQENLASCDTLLTIGRRRFKIAGISATDLSSLELDRINAHNSLEIARRSFTNARTKLAIALGLDSHTPVTVRQPVSPIVHSIDKPFAETFAHSNSNILRQHDIAVLEARKEVKKASVEALFNASVNFSIGFNQYGPGFADAYRNLQRQDLVTLSLNIPLIDWGKRKGKLRIAHNSLEVANIARSQQLLALSSDVDMTIDDFLTYSSLAESASKALDVAESVCAQTRSKFIHGNADINSLILSNTRRNDAMRTYISALRNLWVNYYKLRKLTLYDFEMQAPLSSLFDITQGVL